MFKRKKIARFEKVSYNEFKNKILDIYNNEFVGTRPKFIYESNIHTDILSNIKKAYDYLILPARQTAGSAGYDFVAPYDIILRYMDSIIIPTGIKVYMKNNWILKIYPRSSFGNNGLKIENTVPIIDSDYYNNSKTEGNIMIKITNENKSRELLYIKEGERFVQGIFVEYGLAEEETPKRKRIGGTGSTNKNI